MITGLMIIRLSLLWEFGMITGLMTIRLSLLWEFP
jgi:hypothetical protein